MSTPEEILGALREMAADAAIGDAFRVKIDHRPNPAAMPTRFAIFQNVPFEAIVAPEPWIEQLTGSVRGIYEISISHESNPSKVIGGSIRVPLTSARNAGDPKFQWPVFDSDAYRGPRDVVYPTRPVDSAPAQQVTPIAQVRPPTPQGQGQDMAGLVSAIAQATRPTTAAPAPDPMLRFLEMQREEARQAENRRLEAEKERERREEKEREREEQRRREDREREERREKEERDREERREQREREHQQTLAEQQRKSQELMVQILTREPKKDPVVEALIAKAIAGTDEASARAASLIQQMSGFMTQMTGMTVQLLHTQAELNSGPQESPVWGLARTALEGYFQMAGAQEQEMQEALQEAAAPALPSGEKQQEAGGEEEQGEEQGDGVDDDEEVSLEKPVERLDRAIRNMAPLAELADALCLAIPTPEFQALVKEAKGDLRVLIQKRYLSWIESKDISDQKERAAVAKKKVGYLSTYLPKAWKVAEQRGVIRAPAKPAAQPQEKHTRAEPQKKKPAPKPAAQATQEKPSEEKKE